MESGRKSLGRRDNPSQIKCLTLFFSHFISISHQSRHSFAFTFVMKNSRLGCEGEPLLKKVKTSGGGFPDQNMETVTINFLNIPHFLRDSAFYKTLNEEGKDDDEVSIPRRCICFSSDVHSLSDFEQMLRVTAFWGLNTLPESLIKFCYDNNYELWAGIVDKIGFELTFAHQLLSIFGSNLTDALPRAIKLGTTDVVNYLAVHGTRLENSSATAAQCGRVDYLELLHRHGHPWDETACAWAAAGGHLGCLAFLHQNGCEWDHHVYVNAARGGHLDCIYYACKNGLPWHVDAGIALARTNDFQTLRYAIEHGCPLHSDLTKWSAYYGNIESLQYLLERSCPVADAMHYACQRGQTHSLQLLRDHGVVWDASTTASAVQYNQLECLQYLRDHGCLWDEECPKEAARNGNAEILQYCLENGCPYNDDLLEDAAASSSYEALDCVQYLVEQQNITMDEGSAVFATAFGNAQSDLMNYLLDSGCPYQYYTDTAPYSLLLYLEIHRDNATEDFEYLNAFDERLLECVQLAADRNYNFTNDVVEFICVNFRQCRKYFELEGYVEKRTYDINDRESSDDSGDSDDGSDGS